MLLSMHARSVGNAQEARLKPDIMLIMLSSMHARSLGKAQEAWLKPDIITYNAGISACANSG